MEKRKCLLAGEGVGAACRLENEGGAGLEGVNGVSCKLKISTSRRGALAAKPRQPLKRAHYGPGSPRPSTTIGSFIHVARTGTE